MARPHSTKPPFIVGNDEADGENENENDIMLTEDHRHPGQYALQYLKTLAAWEYAISQTTRLKVFRPDIVPTLFIVDPPRLQNMTMTSISDLVEELEPRLVTDYFDMTSVNEALAKFVTYFDRNKRPFGGSVHCEALLMSLTASHMTELCGWTDSQEPSVAQLTAEERKVFDVTGFSTCYFAPLLSY
jgi:hypothetical protein